MQLSYDMFSASFWNIPAIQNEIFSLLRSLNSLKFDSHRGRTVTYQRVGKKRQYANINKLFYK